MRRFIAILVVASAVALGAWLMHKEHATPEATRTTWLSTMSPGTLAPSHAFLKARCETCHTPLKGVTDAACTSCHAANESLLSRQPTAFHADIGHCTACHVEHQGRERLSPPLDHEVLLRIGKTSQPDRGKRADVGNLDCFTCHSKQDRHRGFFGKECQSCHQTMNWRVSGYRHPSPTSRQCAQCHQAPPSHYMEHFRMVSMKVAGREHANVNQCYLCHRTTAWNDIEGVGWYKHH